MNYRIRIDATSCQILQTGDAIGPNVVGSLKVARATLSDLVDKQISELRAAKLAAVKVREADLPVEQAVPITGGSVGSATPAEAYIRTTQQAAQ